MYVFQKINIKLERCQHRMRFILMTAQLNEELAITYKNFIESFNNNQEANIHDVKV